MMASEFALDLCFIREHAQPPFKTVLDQQLRELFVGRGSWYIDYREEDLLDIAVAEVKGLGIWESEDDLLCYIEDFIEKDGDSAPNSWQHLQGYQVKVTPKVDAGCCRVKTR
ncbi:hypothetical protein [Paenibacillus sp. OAS669]|uniref:hypothetical protein n=1 Tax=Paenibacillus sp. OAS669 TaxID=2663821 RepID=UPI00178AFCD8|nr:hypothetical protein [Paenibacillus sp. OAS669]MBE1445875.1 hypothetical protein [Paenibacillus sp. OAS669]